MKNKKLSHIFILTFIVIFEIFSISKYSSIVLENIYFLDKAYKKRYIYIYINEIFLMFIGRKIKQ